MKIDDLLYGPNGIRKDTTTTAKGAAGGGIDFQQLLDQQLQQGAVPAAPVGAPGLIDSVAPVAAVSPSLRIEGLSLTESALDTLDAFGAALANGNVSGADLAPYADAMEEGVAGLMSVRNQLPADDQLGQLVERVATVSYLEAAKFRRGDYTA